MNKQAYTIRNATPHEFAEIGQLLVEVYAQLEGFPQPAEQPDYYAFLANIGDITQKPGAVLFVAQAEGEKRIAGTVVYVGDMRYYSPLGIAAGEQDGAGCRLLAVAPWAQGQGVGRQLTEECISQAKKQQKAQLILHSTQAMQVAWKMYEAMGFKRAEELDFLQGNLPVFGFRLPLA